jgi:hypothetical protein
MEINTVSKSFEGNGVEVLPETNPDPAIEVLHWFKPIQEWEITGLHVIGKLTARIIRQRGRIFLDIREWQRTDKWIGFTKRGLRLSIHELRTIENYIFPEAKDILKQYQGANRSHSVGTATMEVTDVSAKG